MVVNDASFAHFLRGSNAPGVSDWKEKAKEFISAHADKIPMKDTWIDNPKGYVNVLKVSLHFFILVPSVRDISE